MDQNSSLVSTFDFNSHTGITSVLLSIRQSELSSSEKNELRDLIFSYTNGGGDESVRIALEQKLSAHNIKLVAPKVSASNIPPAPVLPFGSYRPTPSFRVPVIAQAVVIVKKVIDTPTSPIVPPVLAPTEVTVVVSSVVEQPVPVVVPIPVVSVPVPQITVVPPAPISSIPLVVPVPQPTINTKYLDRIREIKSSVNSKVGNPVNLVDINNEIGREYMNALLEAMKKLNGGSIAELDKAMQRLELSYIAVEKAIIEHEVASTSQPQQVVEPLPQPPVAPVISVSSPVSVSAQVTVPLVEEAQIIENILPSVSEPVPVPILNVPEPAGVNSPNSFNITSIGVQSNENPSPVSVNNIELRKIPSLAEERKNLTPQDLPERLSTSSDTITNPLFSGEIDSGLDQLLSDWSLFKKSGLFGSGPKGREHPLYLKISGLQIPLLLAGRFEGANQEIKQSITDYMNGWRYEQGIIYEQGETFEMYLRRVIKHILDLQKRRNPS